LLTGEVIIQEKLALEKVEEPAGTSIAATSGTSSANATPATPVGAVTSTVAAPGEPTSGSSAGARRPAPERGGAESDADLVNSQHLQVILNNFFFFFSVVGFFPIITLFAVLGFNGYGISS
jgi:hypothetical protein